MKIVLLVEDDDVDRMAFVRFFEKKYRIHIAGLLTTGIIEAAQVDTDIVVCDYSLPDMIEGFSLGEFVKRVDAPVIVFSDIQNEIGIPQVRKSEGMEKLAKAIEEIIGV